LRQQFAIVLQEPVLFSTSIAENIAYARPDASGEDIVWAAKLANAHNFISALPEGYETNVGERGMRLSGGERQRISLARAFLKDAPILVLDEPTSSVDIKTESVIMEAMERLMKGRTTFLIAHRLSTLENCDLRLELESGRLVALLSAEALVPGGGKPGGPTPGARPMTERATIDAGRSTRAPRHDCRRNSRRGGPSVPNWFAAESRRFMTTTVTASIIINNYNYGLFLKDAIDSALQQSYPDVEVIVVDDGSTDDSREVIAGYGDRIIPVLKQNRGQASAFNAGFARSSGEGVFFLDADDMLLDTAVERSLPFFRNSRTVKVHWPLWEIDRRGNKTGDLIPHDALPEGDLRELVLREGPASHASPPTSGNAWARS